MLAKDFFFLGIPFRGDYATWLDILSHLGPFMGGLGLLTASIAAWYTATAIKRRELYLRRVETFRALYHEFWKDDDVTCVRKWIVSDYEYNHNLRRVLDKRNNMEQNELAEEENLKLDKVDRFLSILVRIKSYSESKEMRKIEKWERRLWEKILGGKFWIDLIYKRRPELYNYIFKHWKDELLPADAIYLTKKLNFD